MKFTDKQWLDILKEDNRDVLQDTPGWMMGLETPAGNMIVSVSQVRWNGSKRPLKEAKIIAIEKVRRKLSQ